MISKRLDRYKKRSNKWPLVGGLFFGLVIFMTSFIFYKVLTLDDFVYVNKTKEGGAEIIGNSFKYVVPFDAVLDSTRGYGIYKLESLWKLSEKDERKGMVVTESIVKNYHLPVYLWKNGGSTNLSLYQRISVLVSKNISEVSDFKFGIKELPGSILINFIQDTIVDESLKFEVEDLTGTQSVIEDVSKIIEVSGAKISTNSKGYDSDLDCEILSSGSKSALFFANLFDCKYVAEKELNGVVRFRLGGKFASRF